MGEKDKSRRGPSQWGVGDSLAVLDQKFPGEKGSVRWHIVMLQQSVLLALKFRAKSSRIFMQ
jgi:hypothetical protein